MNYRKPFVGLTLFILVSVALTSMVFTTLRREIPGDSDTYYAIFTDVSGLHEGDDVRMAGVRVGRVENVSLEGINAMVTFRVQADQSIFGNTIASVIYQNIVGQRYLGLSLGSDGTTGKLAPGAVIPPERTEPSFDIGLLLNGFEPLFSVLEPQKVDDLTRAVIQALQGDTDSITALVEQTTTMTQTLVGRDEILGGVITNLNSLVSSLAQQSKSLKTVLSQSKAMIIQLNGRREELVSNAGSISSVARRLAGITQSIHPQFAELVGREPGFLKHLIEIEPQLAFLGANAPLALLAISNAFQQGAYVDLYGCELDVTFIPGTWQVLPTIVNAATPGGKPMYTPKCRPTP